MTQFRSLILNRISESSGLPLDNLDDDALLEADLGFDSLKLIGVCNSLLALLPPAKAKEMGADMSPDTLSRFQTLGEVVDAFEQILAQAGVAPVQAPASAPAPIDNNWRAALPPGRPFVLTGSQWLFVLAHQIVNSTSLCSSVVLQGRLDQVRARAAWQALVDRHVSLRTCFAIPPHATSFSEFDCWLLDSPKVPALPVTDLSAFTPMQQEARVEQEFETLLNRNWDLGQWPLHGFSLLKLNDTRHVLYLSNEHVISDGLGNQQIMREFLALYGALETGVAPVLAPVPTAQSEQAVHYQTVVNALNDYRSEGEAKAFDEYSLRLGRANYKWNPEPAHRPQGEVRFINRRYIVDAARTARLLELTGTLRVSLYALLVTAYVKAAVKLDPSTKDPIIQLPTGGKLYPGIDASDMLGCFAQSVALRFHVKEDALAETARGVHQTIETALANGNDREATRRMAHSITRDFRLENAHIPEHVLAQMRGAIKSNLYFPFTGHTHIAERQGSLEVLDYRAGTSNVAGTLDVLQEIHNGCLHVFMNYDHNLMSRDGAERFVAAYLAALDEVAQMSVAGIATVAAVQCNDADLVREVLNSARKVLGQQFTENDLHEDLEARFGVDSLERIRLVGQLSQNRQINRQQLLECRTLAELAHALEGGRAPAPAVVATTSVAQRAATAAHMPDAALAPIPFLHIIAQAQHHPERIAVSLGDEQITYGELQLASNRLAHQLQALGVQHNDRVALLSGRGPNMLIGILGILKAGATYIPIDPDYPAARAEYIARHSAARVVVYEHRAVRENGLLKAVSANVGACLALDVDADTSAGVTVVGRAAWMRQSTELPVIKTQPDDLMVVLYTSGSTGQPKGVALGHRGYMNRLDWHQRVFQLQPGEKVAQKTSCCFDISVWELFWPLMVGGQVSAVTIDVVRNPWMFQEWLAKNGIAICHFVPSMFGEFVHAHQGNPISLPALRWLIFSGEALPVATVREWMSRSDVGSTGLANLYGPTEASIDVSCEIVAEIPAEGALRIPIGAAIDNTVLFVIDDEGKMLPKGQVGELCLAGVQLAQGYLNDPEKTAQAFIPNIYPGVPGQVVYKTGDLAAELPNGSFDYHGRKDSQVKLRGFRIELGEIEAVLAKHPQVAEAAALVLDVRGHQKLIAWYASSSQVEEDVVRKWLRSHLPEYMIPHKMFVRDSLPKNHNGKLDRGVLRKEFEGGESGAAPTAAPQTPAAPAAAAVPVKAAEAMGEGLELAPAQKWVVNYFNAPYRWWGYSRMTYHGCLDLDAFNAAINGLMSSHAALRTVFRMHKGRMRRFIETNPPRFEAKFFDGRGLTGEDLNRLVRQEISGCAEQLRLGIWPLIDVLIVWTGVERFDISFVAHHMVGDLIAGNIMFREIWKNHDLIVCGQTPNWQPVPGTERLVVQLSQNADMDAHRAYWLQQFPDANAGFSLPQDHELGENTEDSAHVLRLSLDRQRTTRLLSVTKKHYDCPLYHILTAPLYRLMAHLGETQRVVISHRVNGRDGLAKELFFDSVDNFAVNYPLALTLEPEESLHAVAQRLRTAMNEVPLKGVSYDWLGEALPTYMYPDNRLTPVRANYLGNVTVPASKSFEICAEDNNQRLAPQGQLRTVGIEFWFSVLDGQLMVDIGYSRNFYRDSTIAQWGDRYVYALVNMIDAGEAVNAELNSTKQG